MQGGNDIDTSPGPWRIILRVAAGEAVGTRFPALATRPESRKAWILAGPKPAGRLLIDEGASAAICFKGRSLLPAGIRKVEGNFTFLMMTDRQDLDSQIYKTFVGCNVVEKDTPRATSGSDLERLLKANHRYIFSFNVAIRII